MTVTVRESELAVWRENKIRYYESETWGEGIWGEGIWGGGGRGTPDLVIDGSDIQAVTINSRAQDVMDEAEVDLLHPNNGGDRSTDLSYSLNVGDRFEFRASLAEPRSTGDWGADTWGGGVWGQGGYVALDNSGWDVIWNGRVEPTTLGRDTVGRAGGSLEANASDWVGSKLSDRNITGAWTETDVGKIIRDICEREAPEVDASNVPDFGITTDEFLNGTNCWDAINTLAARADALITQEGRQLHITPVGELYKEFTLTRDDYLLPWDTKTDSDIANVILVDSGTTREREQVQEQRTGWERVTGENRLTHRLRARKSEIHSIDLYVSQQSDNDLEVRLQADEGGEPVAIDSQDSDIARASWTGDDLPEEGWQAVFFDDHTLPDRDPWMIIESSDAGQDVAINDLGIPAYRSYYPHPIILQRRHAESIAEYGRRDDRIEKEDLDTLVAVRDAASTELARRAFPSKTISFEANSYRAHRLRPGAIIEVDEPGEDAVGEFIVTEVSHSYEAETPRLVTEITADWRKGILAPPT